MKKKPKKKRKRKPAAGRKGGDWTFPKGWGKVRGLPYNEPGTRS